MAKKKTVKTKTESNRFNTAELKRLLKAVYLSGTIKEALLKVDKGVCRIDAIDPSNCVFVSADARICGGGNYEIGIADINLIIKLLDTVSDEEVEFEINNQQLIFKIKSKGEVKFAIIEPELVSTYAEKGREGLKDIMAGLPYLSKIRQEDVKNYLYFMGLLNSVTTTIKTNKKEAVIGSGKNEDNSFQTPFGKSENDPGSLASSMNISIYGELFKNILGELSWGENEESPKLYLGKDNPVVIEHAGTYWAITQESEVGGK